MQKPKTYVGLNNEINGGMTTIGKIIRDAWVFGIIEESETCENWTLGGVDALLQKVNAAWDNYGCLPRFLPPELREKHTRIHNEAIKKARESGWSGEHETQDEDE